MTSRSLLDFPMCVAMRDSTRDQPADDWDLLFDAVRARLRMIAGACPELDSDVAAEARRRVLWIRAAVLECTDDLDRLHAMLAAERGREAGTAHDDSAAHAGAGRAPGLRNAMRDHAQRRLDAV